MLRTVDPVERDQDRTEQNGRFAVPDFQKALLLLPFCQVTTVTIQRLKVQARIRPKTETKERS